MRQMGKAVGRAAAIAALMAAGGCASVDRFGDRAVGYNEQLASARKTIIVQNVLRAADDQPLQFSEVSTITGQGTATAGSESSLPVAGIRAGGQLLYSLMPSASFSGGPSFTVANLNTQAFLNGIIEPVRPEIIAHYAEVGYSRFTLLPLLIASIEFERGGDHFTFVSDPRQPERYRQFMQLLGALIDRGLTFETVEKLDPVGPVLLDEDLRSPGVTAALLAGKDGTGGLLLKSFALGDANAELTGAERTMLAGRKATGFYRLTKATLTSRYCLSPASVTLRENMAGVTGDDRATRRIEPFTVEGQPFVITTGAELQCGVKPGAAGASVVSASAAGAAASDKTAITGVRFTSRSVRSVFAFLGQIAAAERGAGSVAALDVTIAGLGPQRVFGIEPDPAGEIGYQGRRYRVTDAAGVTDQSNRTIQLLSELIALYSSAASFPAPSVIPILTR